MGAKAGIAKGQALSPWPAPAKRELGTTPLSAKGGTDQTDQFWSPLFARWNRITIWPLLRRELRPGKRLQAAVSGSVQVMTSRYELIYDRA